MVRLCLGQDALAARKLVVGNPLTVLGVEITLSDSGAVFWPEPAKLTRWLQLIHQALRDDALVGGEASKLSGELQWGIQHAFRRLGRAMIRPIIRCTGVSVRIASCVAHGAAHQGK